MRVMTMATIAMLGLMTAACSGSKPKPPPLVEVAPALSPDAPTPASSVAVPAAPDLYKQDLDALCNAGTRAPGASAAAKEAKPKIIADWLAAQLKTDKARELMRTMGTIAPPDRPAIIRKELDGQGIKACPFLDDMH
jgi:hypothetical protein